MGTAVRSPGRLGFQRFGGGIYALSSSQISMRQEDAEARDVIAGPANASEGDSAAVFLNNAFADPQAQAGALGGFGGEEGLEEVPGMFGIDADAGVDRRRRRCPPGGPPGEKTPKTCRRSLPPSGMACIALPIRFRKTCFSSTGKPWTMPRLL